MRDLWQQMQTVRAGINERVSEWVAEAGGKVQARADARAEMWHAIRDIARTIRPLAEDGAWDRIREPYADLSARCAACHAQSVSTPRDFLAPAAWTNAGR